jgi:hypothetical protein
MRTLDEEYEAARPVPPFSNSSQGCGWMANNCDRCLHDKEARNDTGPGCPLVAVALMGRTPAQWLCETEKDWTYGNFRCINFRNENDGPGPEPQPIPDPPGQLTLAPRGDYEGHRMLTNPQPQEVPAQ